MAMEQAEGLWEAVLGGMVSVSMDRAGQAGVGDSHLLTAVQGDVAG